MYIEDICQNASTKVDVLARLVPYVILTKQIIFVKIAV